MAVVGEPALVIADEPSAELDPAATAALADLLKVLSGLDTTLVIASHDPVLMAVADQVLVIRNGTLAARGTGADRRWRCSTPPAASSCPTRPPGCSPAAQARIEADGDSLQDRTAMTADARHRAHAGSGQALPARSGSGRR